MRPEVLGGSSPDRQSELHVRFEREAQATSSLRSPHTIQLYDFGVADDGTFYYVMELLDGFDLESLVERFGPIPARASRASTQAGVSLARGGPCQRTDSPGHQTGQRIRLPIRPRSGLRQGPGLRPCEAARRTHGIPKWTSPQITPFVGRPPSCRRSRCWAPSPSTVAQTFTQLVVSATGWSLVSSFSPGKRPSRRSCSTHTRSLCRSLSAPKWRSPTRWIS